MAHPLSGDEDGCLDVEGEDDLFERGRVVVPHQVVYQALVLTVGLGPLAIADACALHDALVGTKIVDKAHETLVQYGKALVEYPLGLFDNTMCHDQTPVDGMRESARATPATAAVSLLSILSPMEAVT